MKYLVFTSLFLYSSLCSALDIRIMETKDSYLTKKNEFIGFGCKGSNLSPKIQITDLPKGTKSLALTVYDPDAPTGGGWWHWLAFNIPVSKTTIEQGAKSLKKLGVVESMTSYGSVGYGGACPPAGDTPHRYIFKVYALKVDKLDLKSSATPSIVGYNLNANAIATASSTVLYGR